MGSFRITKSIKKDFTEEEEVERIFSNLKRLHTISLYPQNNVREGIVAGTVNCKICGIDKSGRERLFFDTSYSGTTKYPSVSKLGIEECRRRNYCVIQKAIGELIPGGKSKFRFLMPLEDFNLYTFNGKAYWLPNNGSGWTFDTEDIQFHDDWEVKNNITPQQNWSSQNSVDICQKVLSVIKKKIMLDKLSGKNEEDYNFLGGLEK